MSQILKDLILFHQGKLSDTRRKEVLELMSVNPGFKDALLGLAFIEEELDENNNIDNFLTKKRAALKHRVFSTKPSSPE